MFISAKAASRKWDGTGQIGTRPAAKSQYFCAAPAGTPIPLSVRAHLLVLTSASAPTRSACAATRFICTKERVFGRQRYDQLTQRRKVFRAGAAQDLRAAPHQSGHQARRVRLHQGAVG